ncbi:MAG: YitT family protein [Bacilli bacterium]
MYKWKLFKKNIHYFFLDHKVSRFMLNNTLTLAMCIISAMCFAIAFRTFISLPNDSGASILHLATGGIGGLAQCIVKIAILCGLSNINYNTLQSIFYFILNIPLLIFSFTKIGVRFSIFTTLNVLFVSIFIEILPGSFFDPIATLLANDVLARVMFSGLLAGLSSACAFISNHCTGGIDVIAYYYSMRKSVNTGKYMTFGNALIILTFTIITLFEQTNGHSDFASAIITAFYSVGYLFVASLVVDMINVRNKKMQLQIVTQYETLKNIIASNVPHSCTVVRAEGGFSGAPSFIIYATVSSSEVNPLVTKIRKADPSSFINVTPLYQVYGKFYIKPIE